jgi:hypothetical protein
MNTSSNTAFDSSNRGNQSQQNRGRNRNRKPRRFASSATNPRANTNNTNSAPEQHAQEIHDPAARQQMKQTFAMALIANPATPLPFPLPIPLGLTTLIFPSQSREA